MDPENQFPPAGALPAEAPSASDAGPGRTAEAVAAEEPYRGLRWIFIGPQGLRSGWCVAIFLLLFRIFISGLVTAALHFHWIEEGGKPTIYSPAEEIISEFAALFCTLLALAIVKTIEGRKLADYYLRDARPVRHVFAGAGAGFLAFSALIAVLAAGGWARLGPATVSAAAAAEFAALWGIGFLLVGLFEEGMFRCYLQFTLTRGINFWWALMSVAAMCLWLAVTVKGNGNWGVYAMAMVGVAPCYVAHRKLGNKSAFWQAAWASSTYFGFVHTGNGGENWIGILQAAGIGFVFCVAVKVTGSAWWAIGCHAAWDWAETYFYGAADSGMQGQGHLLSTAATGNPLWSGGTDGPEGSVLAGAAILLLLVLVVVYGRWSSRAHSAPATPPGA
jgi:uncharacterized protein